MKKRHKIYLSSVVLLLIACSGCSKNSTSSYYNSSLFVKLVDAPASFESIEIVVQRVEIHNASMLENLGWRVVSNDMQYYDILKLRNGNFKWLVGEKIPSGTYDKFKIVFNIGSIVVDGSEYRLEPDKSIKDGAIFDYQFSVDDGDRFQLTFDMEVGESIFAYTGVTKYYILKPSFRIQPTLLAGNIAGQIQNPDSTGAAATISTILEKTGDKVTTTSEPNTGSFQITDIPEGFYSVTIAPEDSNLLAAITIDSIYVERQRTTNISVHRFQQK
ncbi:MAG TPA: DUF4382 domain-containing protein [Bacteroidota bacterium]|nr:DUF4382 domain-containing protein [Bacteroidota bacterium]